ncbi:MAG TPA: ATP-dependent helicase, partial [Pyrinomonadaceae bacterium]
QLMRLARVLCAVVECKTPGEQLSAVLRFYRPLLKNKYDDVQRRGRDLEHLQAIVKRYKTSSKLLDDIALDPAEAVQENMPRRSSGFVTLSTVHSAKGLEWDNVFLIWMTDGWFPSSRFQDEFDDFEEERRLLYVATTRAKKDLHFVYPAVDIYRGPETDGTPTLSRFLEPIPPSILPHASLAGE